MWTPHQQRYQSGAIGDAELAEPADGRGQWLVRILRRALHVRTQSSMHCSLQRSEGEVGIHASGCNSRSSWHTHKHVMPLVFVVTDHPATVRRWTADCSLVVGSFAGT